MGSLEENPITHLVAKIDLLDLLLKYPGDLSKLSRRGAEELFKLPLTSLLLGLYHKYHIEKCLVLVNRLLLVHEPLKYNFPKTLLVFIANLPQIMNAPLHSEHDEIVTELVKQFQPGVPTLSRFLTTWIKYRMKSKDEWIHHLCSIIKSAYPMEVLTSIALHVVEHLEYSTHLDPYLTLLKYLLPIIRLEESTVENIFVPRLINLTKLDNPVGPLALVVLDKLIELEPDTSSRMDSSIQTAVLPSRSCTINAKSKGQSLEALTQSQLGLDSNSYAADSNSASKMPVSYSNVHSSSPSGISTPVSDSVSNASSGGESAEISTILSPLPVKPIISHLMSSIRNELYLSDERNSKSGGDRPGSTLTSTTATTVSDFLLFGSNDDDTFQEELPGRSELDMPMTGSPLMSIMGDTPESPLVGLTVFSDSSELVSTSSVEPLLTSNPISIASPILIPTSSNVLEFISGDESTNLNVIESDVESSSFESDELDDSNSALILESDLPKTTLFETDSILSISASFPDIRNAEVTTNLGQSGSEIVTSDHESQIAPILSGSNMVLQVTTKEHDSNEAIPEAKIVNVEIETPVTTSSSPIRKLAWFSRPGSGQSRNPPNSS
jgi:hypothetical protein